MPDGKFAVDNDKRWDVDENVLSQLVSLSAPSCPLSAIDVLRIQGKVMEKMLTSDAKDMKRFMKSAPESAVTEAERNQREAYRYVKVCTPSSFYRKERELNVSQYQGSSLLMRSQLDCHDDRLPGSGTFDIKTRAAVVIRHDRANYGVGRSRTLRSEPLLIGTLPFQENSVYDIHQLTGLKDSFEKE